MTELRALQRLQQIPQLEDVATHWRFPDPLPDPLPFGKSRLDGLDRKTLIRLWQEHEREWGGRSSDELDFYIRHEHWPEQGCDEKCKKI